jgi:pimeloyl-ACP methyl ester carboxylesterase
MAMNREPDPARTDVEDRRASWLRWDTMEVRGRTVEFGEAGSGPPLLFLHGWGLDHKAYKRPLSRLVASGHRVLAPALPGFGGSTRLRGRDSSLGSLAAWVEEFLDALGVTEPVVVVGHSFGGGVAITFVHDHPGRARALVLLNSIGGSAWSRHGSAVKSMAERPLWDWGIHFPGDIWPTGQARRVLPVILGEALPNLARDPGAFVRAAGVARRADLTVELEELKRRRFPVVVLWGRRDKIITQDSFDTMCEALGDSTVLTVDGTHSWMIADPDTFGEVMTNVLDVVTGTLPTAPVDRDRPGAGDPGRTVSTRGRPSG